MSDDIQTTGSAERAESVSDGSLYEVVLNAIGEGVVLLSGAQVLSMNPAAQCLLGLSEVPEDFETAITESGMVSQDQLRAQYTQAVNGVFEDRALHMVQQNGAIECVEIHFLPVEENKFIGIVRERADWESLERVQLLAAIGRLGAEKYQNVDGLVEDLLETLFERLNVDIAVLALFDGDRLRPVGWRGVMLDPVHVCDPQANYYVNKAIEARSPVTGDGGEWDGAEMTGSHVVLPLTYSGEVVGTLHLGSLQSARLFDRPGVETADGTNPFDGSGLAYLRTLGAYLASAIRTAELFADREAETARLEALVRHFREGVLLYNGRGEILFFNDAAKEILEFTPRNLNKDSRPYRIKSRGGENLPRPEWPFFKVVRAETEINSDVVFGFADGRRKIVSVRAVPLPRQDGHIPVYLGTLDDITDRAEQDKRKDEFLSIASHELRNPLTPLTGFLQMIRRQVHNDTGVDEDLVRRSQDQVSRLSRLIDVLLDLTRIETGRMVMFFEEEDLGKVVHRVVCSWSDHPSGVNVKAVLPSEPMPAKIDSARIDQVLSNLIDNSIKYSDEQGVVLVTLEAVGNTAILKVVDQGHGIEANSVSRVFEQFYQAGDSGKSKSMGLGLFITKQVVAHHGGTIEIDSVLGEGTSVRVTLPLRQH